MSAAARAEGAVRSRSHRIVAFLEADGPDGWGGKLDSGRIKNLPGMLQRNGLLQVAVFLEHKGEDKAKATRDRALRALLEGAMRAIAGPEMSLDAAYLAKQDLRTSLFLEELALEVASWISRLCPGDSGKAS